MHYASPQGAWESLWTGCICICVFWCYHFLKMEYPNQTAPLFDKLYILPLCHLNDFQVGYFMNALLPNHFCNMFTKNTDFHSYETRNRHCVHMTACTLTLRKYSIRFFGPTLWNCLSLNIRNSQTIHLFKRYYESFLIRNITE